MSTLIRGGTVISLRDAAVPGMRPPDWEEEQYCLRQEMNYVRLPPKVWWSTEGPVQSIVA